VIKGEINANIIAADDDRPRRPRRNTFGVVETPGLDDSDSVDAPRTLGIRKDPPESSTVASAPAKQPKCSTAGLRTRPRAGDFDKLTQAVLDTAISEYRAIICTRDPFPDAVSNQEISAQVWVNACASLDIQIQPSLEIMKLVCLYCHTTSKDSKPTFIYR
jgi:hypothetical protein